MLALMKSLELRWSDVARQWNYIPSLGGLIPVVKAALGTQSKSIKED